MDDKNYDEALEKFLNSEANSLYVKADSIDVRVHLIGTFSRIVEEDGAERAIEEFKKLEQYIKYG